MLLLAGVPLVGRALAAQTLVSGTQIRVDPTTTPGALPSSDVQVWALVRGALTAVTVGGNLSVVVDTTGRVSINGPSPQPPPQVQTTLHGLAATKQGDGSYVVEGVPTGRAVVSMAVFRNGIRQRETADYVRDAANDRRITVATGAAWDISPAVVVDVVLN